MALDHPTTIGRVIIIEIIPTSDMWKAFSAEATADAPGGQGFGNQIK